MRCIDSVLHLLFRKKSSVSKVDPCGVCRICLIHNCSVEEKLEFRESGKVLLSG